MSNIVLLLDEIMEPSDIVVMKIKKHIINSIFKEIWLVTRNCNAYKLY